MGRLWRFLGANPTLTIACLVIFVNQLGFGIIVPVTPLYARTFGATDLAVGLVVAVYGLGRLFFNLPAGRAADRFGRRPVILAGTLITSLGSLLCGLADDFTQLLIFRFVGGVGAAVVITGIQVVVADVATRENRGRMMGTYMGFFTVGVGVGPTVGGLIAELADERAPFFAFAVLALAAGTLAVTKLPETRGAAPAGAVLVAPSGSVRQLLTNVGFTTVALITFVQFFNRTGAIFAVVPLMGVERLSLDPASIGFALTAASLCNIALVGIVGVMVDRFGRKPVIVPGCLISAIAFVGFAYATGYGAYVGSAILWGMSGAFMAGSAAYAADMAPPGANGLTMGVYRSLADAGYVAGPIALGLMADWIGGNGALLFAAGLSFITLVPFLLLAPETGGRRLAGTRPA